MASLGPAFDSHPGLAFIAAAGVAFYVASKAAKEALLDGRPATAGRVAVGHWMPVAVCVVAAAAVGRFDVAMGVGFSAAVASLSLGIGAATAVATAPISGSHRRAWPLLVTAGLASFVGGFSGRVTPLSAECLAVLGLCTLLVWRIGSPAVATAPVQENAVARHVVRGAQILLAAALALVGAWLGGRGVTLAADASEYATPGLLSAMILAPLLVLPILGTGVDLAQRNQADTAVAAHVGFALLCATTLVPAVGLVAAGRGLLAAGASSPALAWVTAHLNGPVATERVPFPLAVWRVDVVLFVALGLFLLPVALGYWPITRRQGTGLIVLYAAYLGLSMKLGILRV